MSAAARAEKQALIDLVAETQPLDFALFLQLAYARRYTGAVTFHFLKGTATSAEIASDSTHIRLDQTVAVRRTA